MRKGHLVLAMTLLFGLILVPPAANYAQPTVLNMMTSFDLEEGKFYIEEFEKDTGVDVEFVRASSGDAFARVKAEAANPTLSLWFAGTNTSHIAAAKEGLLEAYDSPMKAFVPARFRDSANNWIGIYVGVIGFLTNKDFLASAKVEPPRSWADLLKPEFKGKISMAFPYTSGTAYTTLATLLQLCGLKSGLTARTDPCTDAGFDFAAKLDQQVGNYTRSGTGCIALAGRGEFPVCIIFAHDGIAKGIRQNFPVVLTFPSEGTGFEIGGMALIKKGPQPGLAKVFYDWALSKRAQELYQNFARVPVHPQAAVAKDAVKLSDVKLADYDENWAGANFNQFIDRWRKLTGK